MSNLNAKEFKAAFVKHVLAWGLTESAVGAGNGMLINSDGYNATRQLVPTEETDTSFAAQDEQTNISFDPTPRGHWRFDAGGLYTMVALALGGVTVTSATEGAQQYFMKTCVPTVDTEGLYGSYAIKQGTRVYSAASVKPYGFSLKADSGGKPWEITAFAMGDQEIANSAVNTPTILGTVTYNDRKNRALFDQTTFWINGSASATLAAANAVQPTSCTVTFKRTYPETHTNHRYRDEPTDDAHPEISVEFGFPRLDATFRALYDKWQANTQQKLQILTTGGLIGTASTITYQSRLRFPLMNIDSVSKGFDGLNRPSINVKLMGRDRTDLGGAPSGMATALPIELYLRHLRSTQF